MVARASRSLNTPREDMPGPAARMASGLCSRFIVKYVLIAEPANTPMRPGYWVAS